MWIPCLGSARLRPIRRVIGHLTLVALLLAFFGVIGSPVPVLARTADLQPAAYSKPTGNEAPFARPCGAKVSAAQRARFAAARPSVLGFALNLQPGKYETTSEILLPSSPVKPTPTTGTACITTKDVEGRWGQNLPSAPGSTCTVSDYRQTGNKVTLTRTCTGQDTITQRGEVTFAGTSYSGFWEMTNSSGRSWTVRFTAKRIGDCSS
jgi:hypothetical protein